jgi:DNA-binding NtrC family response regulator
MPHNILLVEDHKVVAQAVKETLEKEGWRVSLCGDGAVALSRLASNAVYARGLEHRKETPIIMFSASECSRDARLAGANEFLRKPQDVGKVVETAARLLDTS